MATERAPRAGAPCIFCEIIARRANAWIVYEDADNLAFLDLFPFTRGHLLVVPKRHVDRLTDLAPAEHANYLGAIAEVCRRVDRLSHHYNVALNQGELAGQVVFHLHFHVIPRYGGGNPFHSEVRTKVTEVEAGAVLTALTPP
jgi:histidine triad (HIT) family protein